MAFPHKQYMLENFISAVVSWNPKNFDCGRSPALIAACVPNTDYFRYRKAGVQKEDKVIIEHI